MNARTSAIGTGASARRMGAAALPVCPKSVLLAWAALALVPLSALANGAAAVTPPSVLTRVDAVLPSPDAGAPLRDALLLELTIGVDGHATDLVVVESAGAPWDAAALEAVRQWTFSPALQNGVPVASRTQLPFRVTASAALLDAGVAEPVLSTTVLGRAVPVSRGASDFHLSVGALREVPRKSATELLQLAPGILLTNEGGEGHPEQIFLRGFDAREGQDLELTVQGVPINQSGNLHGNGYADLHFLIPELVTALRVVEGPFDPRQGNYAVAGSADYALGLAERGLTAKLSTGAFGTHRAVLLFGQGAGTFGGVELFQTDGHGENRDARRGSAMAQVEGQGGHTLWRISASAYAAQYHSAGILRDDDVAAGRIGFYDTYDFGQGGESTRFSLSADVEARDDDLTHHHQLYAVRTGTRLRENYTGFLLDAQGATQRPHGQRGDLLDLTSTGTQLGARGWGRLRATALGQRQELELGYFARLDFVDGDQYRIEAATNHPYRKETDLGATLGDLGLHADAHLRFTPWLALRGGVRADLFTYDVLDRCAVQEVAHPSRITPPGDQSCLSQEDFGRYREPVQRSSAGATALMPRVTVVVGPFEGVTFTASYGEGARSVDPQYVTQDVRTPFAAIRAAEVGSAYAGRLSEVEVAARAVGFTTHVERDLVFSESAGRNTLGAGTTRWGGLAAVRATGGFFDLSANATYVRSRYDDTGLLVAYVPDLVARVDSSLFQALPLAIDGTPLKGTLALGVTYVGRRPLPYGQRSDVLFTVDLAASVAWRAFALQLSATNLLDRRYRLGEYDFPSDFHGQDLPTLVPVRHFTAGAPRALLLTLSFNLGGAR